MRVEGREGSAQNVDGQTISSSDGDSYKSQNLESFINSGETCSSHSSHKKTRIYLSK